MWSFSLSGGSEFGKNALILGADMSSSVYVDSKKKDFDSWLRSIRWYCLDYREIIFYKFY